MLKTRDLRRLERAALTPAAKRLGFAPKAIFGTSEIAWVRRHESGFEAVFLVIHGRAPEFRLSLCVGVRIDAIADLVTPHCGFVNAAFAANAFTASLHPHDLGRPDLEQRAVDDDAAATTFFLDAAAWFESALDAWFVAHRTASAFVADHARELPYVQNLAWPRAPMMRIAAAYCAGDPRGPAWLESFAADPRPGNPLDDGRRRSFVAAMRLHPGGPPR